MMRTLLLTAAAAALAMTTAVNADTVVKETESGVYSAPVAGATPQARENPSTGTTMGETRENTTVIPQPQTRVIEQRPATGAEVEIRERVPN